MAAAPFMYTGALENHPQIVEQLQSQRSLLGINASSIQRVRNPFQLSKVMGAIGHPMPAMIRDLRQVPTDGSWLKKNARGSGGAHVRPWFGGTSIRGDHVYFQKHIEGISASAVFVASGGEAAFVGATRQLTGTPWSGATPFAYSGSIGPLTLHPTIRKAWRDIGNAVANEFNLSGLFGVDAILQGRTLQPLEVNPRYTASVEVLERALRIPVIALHVGACEGQAVSSIADFAGRRMCGKAVLYAHKDLKVDERFALFVQQQNRAEDWPAIADIPRVGTFVQRGKPLCTVLAEGPDPQAVERELHQQANTIKALFD